MTANSHMIYVGHPRQHLIGSCLSWAPVGLLTCVLHIAVMDASFRKAYKCHQVARVSDFLTPGYIKDNQEPPLAQFRSRSMPLIGCLLLPHTEHGAHPSTRGGNEKCIASQICLQAIVSQLALTGCYMRLASQACQHGCCRGSMREQL